MADAENPMVKNRSMLKDFLASIATMNGDLSNITAPPFVLDPRSVVEIPSFYAENPTIFVAPATSEDPVQRALLMLQSFLAGLKSQCYLGRSGEGGVKKPLNAFLGELFIGRMEDDNGTTHICTEQVSHHPPVTACCIWNDKYGVVAEGYNRQEITFNGSVNVQSVGHVMKSLTKYDERYFIPIPNFKIKGVLGTPYPETSGTYYITSTTEYTSVIHFKTKGFFSSISKNHEFTAHLYRDSDGESKPLYTVEGSWDGQYTFRDNRSGEIVETFDISSSELDKQKPTLLMDSLDEQDPWESQRAWSDVSNAIKQGDMKGTSDAKGRLEQGQRDMRKDEEAKGMTWENLFFRRADAAHDKRKIKQVEELNSKVPGGHLNESKTDAEEIWTFDFEAWKNAKKPYHGNLRPDNSNDNNATTTNDTASSVPQEDEEKKGEAAISARAKNTDNMGAKSSTQRNHSSGLSPVSHGTMDEPKVSAETDATDHTVGAVDANRPTPDVMNGTLIDVGRQPPADAIEGITKDQPAPQAAQVEVVQEHRGSGIEGMSVAEKAQIENMLRDQYSNSWTDKRRRSSAAKRQ